MPTSSPSLSTTSNSMTSINNNKIDQLSRLHILLRHIYLSNIISKNLINSNTLISHEYINISFYNNGCGLILLNRPKRINSLTAKMDEFMNSVLDSWSNNKSIKFVVFGSTSNNFCAGGDLREVVSTKMAPYHFFHANYTLDYKIATYIKPIISIYTGVTMGGGVGISFHSKYRITTQTTRWSMPEVSIGMCPDVGSTYFFHRFFKPHIGSYLGFMGAKLNIGDLLYTGIATHYIDAKEYNTIINRLTIETMENVISSCFENKFIGNNELPFSSFIQKNEAIIKSTFTYSSLKNLILNIQNSIFAKDFDQNCPRSIFLTYIAMQLPKSLAEALMYEFRCTVRLGRHSELFEGVNAKLIEKREPKWLISFADILNDCAENGKLWNELKEFFKPFAVDEDTRDLPELILE